MDEREREVVRPLEVVDDHHGRAHRCEGAIRSLEDAHGSGRARRTEGQLVEQRTVFRGRREVTQQVARSRKRDEPLGLVPDDAEDGQAGFACRLRDEPRLSDSRLADDDGCGGRLIASKQLGDALEVRSTPDQSPFHGPQLIAGLLE
jgi:hypothetical protein